jgi:hypothetical protein
MRLPCRCVEPPGCPRASNGREPALLRPPAPIDRDDLVIPEVLVQDVPAAAHAVLKPLFDAVCNAGGWPRSPYYTDEGEWQEPA